MVIGSALAGPAEQAESAAAAFFTGGALVLVGSLLAGYGLVAGGLGKERQAASARSGDKGPTRLSLGRLAWRYARRRPTRSWLTASLVACATFAIVAVALGRGEIGGGTAARDSGTGGFALIGESPVPLAADPGTPAGRRAMKFADGTESAMAGARIYSLRVKGGDDTSCLNLSRPSEPQVAGAPAGLIRRGGFSFAAVERSGVEEAARNPWLVLTEKRADGSVPAFGDEASVRWILHSGLGEMVTVMGPRGPVRLRIVGLLKGSLWQHELVISEEAFVSHFGAQGGYREFLVETDAGRTPQVSSALVDELGDLGFRVESAQDALGRYAGVQSAYLSAFQTLGWLGLVLGTFGVVAVLLRNVVERRGELALMMAVGFGRAQVSRLVVTETMGLVAAGMAVGFMGGLVAMAPQVAHSGGGVSWAWLAASLLAVLAVSWLACEAATRRVVGESLLEALRSE